MNAKHNMKSGIEQQFNAISMSERVRNAALRDAQVAEMFVDALAWVCRQAGRLGDIGFAKPSPKY